MAGARVEEVRSMLNKPMRVKVTDGRVLEGMFLCFDKQENVLLGRCYESSSKEGKEDFKRFLGTVVVPKSQQSQVFLEANHSAGVGPS